MFYNFAKSLIYLFTLIFFRIKVYGAESIPDQGACILCFNHRSLLDPPVTGVYIKRSLVFMAKEELFKIPLMGFILKNLNVIPVRRGTGDVAAIKASINALKEGKVMVIYPEGTRSKSGDLQSAKPGVALIATKAKAPVIPIGVTGQYGFMKKLSIKIGNPIHLEPYYDRKLQMEELHEISDKIMNDIKQLMEEK